LAKGVRTPFVAVVTDARARGLFVELVESMTYGFVSASKLGDDHYVLNTAGTALVGRKKRKVYAVGTRFDVVVEKVDRYRRLIDFRPA
jgi:ribonuclease R